MLLLNVPVGGTVSFTHSKLGAMGSVKVNHKSSSVVQLAFDMPKDMEIRRMMNHQESNTSFGITGEARAPLRHAPA